MNLESVSSFVHNLYAQKKLETVLSKDLDTGFSIGKKKLGKELVFIAGPCSVEDEEMIIKSSLAVKSAGCDALRGGAYKPCTYPVNIEKNGWKEGTREQGLRFLKSAKKISGLQVVSEVMSPRQLEASYDFIDIIQVGTRNFQNYALLDELAKQSKPVILKRGTWATLEETLGACERLLNANLTDMAICLRGIIGGPPYRHIYPSTRWQPDLMMLCALKEHTNIPVIYDPSHATGRRQFVKAISQAAVACGCDGLIIEAHPDPPHSVSDADQAISFDELKILIDSCLQIQGALSCK